MIRLTGTNAFESMFTQWKEQVNKKIRSQKSRNQYMYQLCTWYHIDYSIFVQVSVANETLWHRMNAEKKTKNLWCKKWNKKFAWRKQASKKQLDQHKKRSVKKPLQTMWWQNLCTTSVTRSFYQFELHYVKWPRYCFHCRSSHDLHVNRFGQILDIMSSTCLLFSMSNISPHQPQIQKHWNCSSKLNLMHLCTKATASDCHIFQILFQSLQSANKHNKPKKNMNEVRR